MHSAPQSSGRPAARSGRTVGRVTGLWRYPVKSMGAEVLAEAEVSWNGLAGDRRWAFIRDGMARSGFPWLTIRQRPEMGRFRPSFVDPDRPDASRTTVLTPSGERFDVADPALAGVELDALRFRPNLLIEASGEEAFPEDAWVGCVLQVGGMRMRIDRRDKRCVMVNIDPLTLNRNPAVLRAIVRERGACLGVYGSTTQPGRVLVGDPVMLDG